MFVSDENSQDDKQPGITLSELQPKHVIGDKTYIYLAVKLELQISLIIHLLFP
jgi:hypothetical protein